MDVPSFQDLFPSGSFSQIRDAECPASVCRTGRFVFVERVCLHWDLQSYDS